MHKLRSTLLTGLLICGGAYTYAQSGFDESLVDVTTEVEGKLVVPNGGETRQAVLIFHGFNDDMDGVGGLQKQLAFALADQGIASLRIDFRGEGKRNDNVITSTLESRKEDAEHAFRFIRKQFPSATLGVSGWSLGGSTTILLIGAHPDWAQSVVLWSSGGSSSRDQLSQARNKERNDMIKKVLTEGKAVMESWTKITYTRENYVSWLGFESEDHLPQYHGAFLGIRGTKDFLPLYEPAWMEILPGKKKAYHVLGDADHIFNVLEPQQNQGDTVVKLTVDWFKDTLK
jgi:pimeloyl-ACP methyl ester carboxylesterase